MLSEQQARPVQRRLIVDLAQAYEMDVESVTSMLYTLLWEVVLHPTPRLRRRIRWADDEYRDSDLSYALKQVFAIRPWPSAQAEALLVGHGRPVQYHLLLLDPDYGGPPVSNVVPRDLARIKLQEYLDRRRSSSFPDEIDFVLTARSGRLLSTARRLLHRALSDLIESRQLRAILAPRPRLEPTSCFSPAGRVKSGSGATSTVGLLVPTSHNFLLATTANHAVAKGSPIMVEECAANIVSQDTVTDSCLMTVVVSKPCRLLDKARDVRRHCVQALPPRHPEDAFFDGAASGYVKTRIRAHDPSILFKPSDPTRSASRHFASKVYTDNDTREGDSGAALYDVDENIIGFAAFRTAYGEDPSYSVWIWARQVIDYHGPMLRWPV